MATTHNSPPEVASRPLLATGDEHLDPEVRSVPFSVCLTFMCRLHPMGACLLESLDIWLPPRHGHLVHRPARRSLGPGP